MPPKAKFTKEEITKTALEIVKTDGFEALISREPGTLLGSSARPIFTVFKNMEEVQQAVIQAAKILYKEYVNKGLTEEHPFKGVGTQYILFSVNEPKLFQLLFMTGQEQTPDLAGVLLLIEESYEKILLSIQEDYEIDRLLAEKLYRHLWIYTHGIARALAKKPKVLFLDEPTGALDEQTGRQVPNYICKLQNEYNFTIVMVTHNLNIAEMANTVIKMNSGKISEIYTNETQKTAYTIGW